MSSLTKQTKTIRANKKKKAGAARKKKLVAQGTTPKFPVHPQGSKAS